MSSSGRMFNRDKHIKYWRMCANILPDHYTSTDSSRMSLGYFIVTALDVLGALETLKPTERDSWRSWIYSCQTPEGGFRGFPGADLGRARSSANREWDPPTVPATFFALEALLILGDDLSLVKRKMCLDWLLKVQRLDGSFGEFLSTDDRIEGGRDLRHCYCAMGIAHILQSSSESRCNCFDVDALVAYIQSCQSYSGGFSESPYKEPQSGLTYCAIAALALVQRTRGQASASALELIPEPEACLRWLAERQTTLLIEEDEEDDLCSTNSEDSTSNKMCLKTFTVPNFDLKTEIAGFNGREGKIADTCYCWWNVGALAVLEREHLIDVEAMQNYLLNKVQHTIGGFGKGVGYPPDVLHSCLGLATLAIYQQDDLKPFESTMCISQEAANRLKEASWNK